jgi:hypothetical protein
MPDQLIPAELISAERLRQFTLDKCIWQQTRAQL